MAPKEHESTPARAADSQPPTVCPLTPEESELTWEDKLDAENIQPNTPEPTAADKKYQHKEGGASYLWLTDPFIHFIFIFHLVAKC